MSTEFFNDQWRIPSNENQNKVSNYSMSFDGSSDYIDAGTGLGNSLGTYTGDASISLWFKADTTASNDGLFSITAFDDVVFGNLRINIYNNVLYFVSNSTGNYKTIPFTDTTSWHHLVCVFKSGDITNSKIYLDGVDQTTTNVGTFPSSLSFTGLKTIIGAYHSVNQVFQGKMDQLSVFDYALSQDQVTQLGAEGYAFNFNGSTQAIDCGAGSRFDIDQITISGWAKLDSSITSTLVIAGIRNANQGSICYHLQNQGTSSKFRFVIRQEDDTYVDAIADDIHQYNTWYHVVGVADGSNVKLYVNGELQTNVNSYDGTIESPNQNFNIGRQPSNPLYYWDGELSNISVFNTGLTGTQVTTLYNSGKPLADMSSFTSLQGWWKLDETATFNSNWSIPDDSTNSNTGTSVGMNASNLVASNINGELIANPMITSPKPIAYYQLGDQSVDNGANYLVPNNSLSDYVFSFSSDLINVANDTTIARQQNISYSLWVNTTSLTAQQYIIGNITSSNKGTGIFIFNNALHFQIGNNTNDSYLDSKVSNLSTYVSANSWFHVAASWDGTDSKIYINSIERNSWTPTQPYTIAGWSAFMIGDNATISSSSYFSGKLSNVAFWNSGLTLTQAQTLYNNGAPGDISSLSPVSWYKLNDADTFDGTDWTINDYGSGGNDGTSSGMDSSNLVVSDLQRTSGYSPYALNFDGVNDYLNAGSASYLNGLSEFSISVWINLPTAVDNKNIISDWNYNTSPFGHFSLKTYNTSGSNFGLLLFIKKPSDIGQNAVSIPAVLKQGNWHNVVFSYDSGTVTCYVDGSVVAGTAGAIPTTLTSQDGNLTIGNWPGLSQYWPGKLSNIALWSVALTQANATEIYNQGVPGDISSLSPLVWWQLGSNSSFNPNPTGTEGTWTCLDEIGSNNAESSNNMTNDAITDGPGYSASGVGTSSIDIIGDAPYSTANGLSENMDVLDRTLDTPIRNTHSIQLDGVDDYIDFGNVNIFERTDAFSGSCWVNLASINTTQLFFTKTKNSTIVGYQFYVTASNNVVFFVGNYYSNNYLLAKTSNTLNINTWYNLAFTYDGSSNRAGIKLYINGVNQGVTYSGPTSITGSILNSSVPFQISGRDGGANIVLDGKIDEVAMFNSKLSAPQVASIYNNGTPNNILPLNPVSWHRFESLTTNGGVVTTADSSGNGLTGTVENGASLSTVVP